MTSIAIDNKLGIYKKNCSYFKLKEPSIFFVFFVNMVDALNINVRYLKSGISSDTVFWTSIDSYASFDLCFAQRKSIDNELNLERLT